MPIQSRAAVLREMGCPIPYSTSLPLSIETVTIQDPGNDEVLIKIHASGLCHSDLSVINGSRPRPMPMALGHECSGEIISLGSNVHNFAVGDHVVMTFTPVCGHCSNCIKGRAALCTPGAIANGKGTLLNGEICISDNSKKEIFHHLGISGFAEYCVVSTASIVKIDKEIPFTIAALFGCAVMTGIGSVINTAKVEFGTTVAVIGMGGVGLSTIIGSIACGAQRVIAIDFSEQKLAIAKQLGATDIIDASKIPDCVQVIRELTEGEGVDFVFEMAGSIRALSTAIDMVKRGGKVTTAGLPPAGHTLPVDVAKLVGNEITLQGSYMGSCIPGRDIPRYIALYKSGKLPVNKLLSETIHINDINAAFDKLHEAKTIRQVIVWNDDKQ